MRRAPKPNFSGELNTASAAERLSKFASGSPIPITTMFSNSNFASALPDVRIFLSTNGRAWATISPAVRLRTNPRIADAQNLHPHAQPTCVLTQSVFLVLPSSAGALSSTHSTKLPSGRANRYFFVSSPAFRSPTSFAGSKSNLSPRNPASFAGRAGKALGAKIFLEYTQSNTCFARNFSNPAAASSEASSSRESA